MSYSTPKMSYSTPKMSDFLNSAEIKARDYRQRIEAKRAVWDGRKAFLAAQKFEDNPFDGWQPARLRTFQGLLWCRWALGWLIEFEHARAKDKVTAKQ